MRVNLILFFLFLSVIFILEGLGISGGRNIAFLLIIIFPYFLFAKDFINRKKGWRFPYKISLLFICFLAFSLISTIFSENIISSISYLAFYISVFLFFIYSYNYKELYDKKIQRFIFIFCVIICNYSFLLFVLNKLHINFLIPKTGYQLVFPTYGHNHLGDFLLLGIILGIYYFFIYRKILYIALTVVFIGFFIFSFSRAAYLVGMFLIIIYGLVYLKSKRKINRQVILLSIVTIFIFLIAFISLFKESMYIPLVGNIHTYLETNFSLKPKSFPVKRIEYITEAYQGLSERNLIGFGPQNFILVSQKYTKIPFSWADSSHNLFIDIFVENGIFAGIAFLGIIILIYTKSKKNTVFLLSLSLLLIFQLDYLHKMYSIFLLYFFLGGLIYKEDSTIAFNKKYFVLVSVLIIAINIVIFMNIFKISIFNYPVNKDLNKEIILNKSIIDSNYDTMLEYYGYLFSGDADVSFFIATMYENKHNTKRAMYYYKKSYSQQPFVDFSRVIHIYAFLKKYESEEIANRFLDSFFHKLLLTTNSSVYTQSENLKIKSFCATEREYICP